MRICCHVTFDGQCELAFRAYERILGGEIATLLKYGDSPLAKQVPTHWQELIAHATLRVDNQEVLLGSDAFPNAYERPQGFCATLSVADISRAKAVFSALAEGGLVQLPLHETFWSAGFGVLVDCFGVPWEINCERPPQSG